MDIKTLIRTIPDYPRPGIQFRDITTLLLDPAGARSAVEQLTEPFRGGAVQKVAGVEARGFIFGLAVAMQLSVGFVPIRKPGKLPSDSTSVEYALEYGTDCLEIHNDGLHPGDSVLVVDDVLATGGTAQAACELVQLIGGQVAACVFLLELSSLNGRDKLPGQNVVSLLIDD